MFPDRAALLAFLRDAVTSRKYGKSEQERLAKMFPGERWNMGTKCFVRIEMDELIEIIRYLEKEGDDV